MFVPDDASGAGVAEREGGAGTDCSVHQPGVQREERQTDLRQQGPPTPHEKGLQVQGQLHP